MCHRVVARAGRPGAAALSLLATLILGGCEEKNAFIAPPPPEVTVSPPVQREVTTYIDYTGTTRAITTVDLRARVKGFLQQVLFKEGDAVKKDQLLMVIDEEPFRATLQQAQAKEQEADAGLKKAKESKAVPIAAAKVALDQAEQLLARIEENRQRTLLTRNAGTQQDVDRAEANRKKYDAQVESDQASLAQSKADFDTDILSAKSALELAKAQVRTAEIDLGYCRIKAPIDGRISRKFVDVDNLVGDAQATVLATIVKEDPMYAYASVSERDLLRFRKMVAEGTRVDFRKAPVPIELGLSSESGYPHVGRIDYVDPAVDPGTGTVQARGIFDNPNRTIVSGLFVRLRVPLEQNKMSLLVPERAVGVDQAGQFVLVVDEKGVVDQKPVTLGSRVDEMRIVESGLKPGDLVVVNGLQRARPGQKVKPRRVEMPAPTTPSTASQSASGRKAG